MKPKTLMIDGSKIHDIPSFYDEINRVFMADVDWKLGPSLDALNDMFYGGYGALQDEDSVVLVWRDFEKSRKALGQETTRAHYLRKLDQPSRFNAETIKRDLAELESGVGKTYFEIILEIIAGHPNVLLAPE